MTDNKILTKLKEAVEAQKRIQATGKAVKTEIERAKAEEVG